MDPKSPTRLDGSIKYDTMTERPKLSLPSWRMRISEIGPGSRGRQNIAG